MYRLFASLLLFILTACESNIASSYDPFDGSYEKQDIVPVTDVEGDLIIVSDFVSWPARVWFCPVSSSGSFEIECSRPLRLPRSPGATNSYLAEQFSVAGNIIGVAGSPFSKVVGERFVIRPSVVPASGRYALVRAYDPSGGIGSRSLNIGTASYIFEPKSQFVAILPSDAPPGFDEADYARSEVEKVRRLMPLPNHTYETMEKVQVECDSTGILFGGDGVKRCQIVE